MYNCSIGGYTHAFHYGKQWICFENARKVKNIVKFCLKFMIAFAKLSRRDILNVAKLIILCDFHSLKIWIWKNFPENPNKNIIIVKIRSLAPFANAILQHFTVILPVLIIEFLVSDAGFEPGIVAPRPVRCATKIFMQWWMKEAAVGTTNPTTDEGKIT